MLWFYNCFFRGTFFSPKTINVGWKWAHWGNLENNPIPTIVVTYCLSPSVYSLVASSGSIQTVILSAGINSSETRILCNNEFLFWFILKSNGWYGIIETILESEIYGSSSTIAFRYAEGQKTEKNLQFPLKLDWFYEKNPIFHGLHPTVRTSRQFRSVEHYRHKMNRPYILFENSQLFLLPIPPLILHLLNWMLFSYQNT